jgi:hypothetical protein
VAKRPLSDEPVEARDESRLPRVASVPNQELARPTLWTLAKLIYNTLARLFHDPAGMLLGSAFLLIMVWGYQGGLELLGEVWEGWQGPGGDPVARDQVIPGLDWDQEAVSFVAGFGFLVVVPCLLIRLVFRQPLSAYGLALPPPERRRIALLSAAALLLLGVPTFLFAAGDDQIRAVYPIFRGEFDSTLDFAAYEAVYLLFFVAIEFMFRGYLLFGLYQFRDEQSPPGVSGAAGPLVFGYYAILISMLSYTAWHLGKPPLELWGTVAWGLGTGVIALVSRSILLIILVHWALNLILDLLIWQDWEL